MQKPLQITFRDMDAVESIESYVRQRATKLEKLCSRITSCHVTIEIPHRHKTHGHHYRVRIDLAVPGAELVVARDPVACTAHEDAYAAVDAAFDDAQRVVKDYVRRRRDEARPRAVA
jgi:ribosomal subunit interface protein